MKTINKSILIWIFAFSWIFFNSCNSKKKVVYLQGKFDDKSQIQSYEPILKNDDLLSIIVTGSDAEVLKPFTQFQTNISNNVGGYTQGAPSPYGYLINSNGYIDFPLIGSVKLAGLSRKDAIDTLKGRISKFASNPVVQIKILNYKVTVLGDVVRPGTFTIPNERITILEALGIAGDLNITGKRKNVLVVRENNGVRKEYRVDLTSSQIVNSEVYYLAQNDVIYIEPNRSKINSSLINPTNAGLVISAVSLLISVLVLISK